MKQLFSKLLSGVLAAAVAASMAIAGTSGLSSVQAAENKALAVPVNFIGATFDTDNWWDLSGTRMGFDLGDTAGFSDAYTVSYTVYIPKASLKDNQSQVRISTWFDFMDGEKYVGNVDAQYECLLVHDNDETFPVIADNLAQKELQPSEYASFFSYSAAGDFYKVQIKDMPLTKVLHIEGDGENTTTLDTINVSQQAHVGMNISIRGLYNKISSIAYLDDLTVKDNGTVFFTTDFSPASLYNRYYDYTAGEDKDENRVESPATAVLNTSLLKLSKTSGTVKVGKKVTIKATAAASGKITYKSSNKKIATVTSKGVVKGVKAGTAKITVSANGISKTFKVTVKKK